MYAKVFVASTMYDEIGSYNEVEGIVEEAGTNTSAYSYFDLSNYPNGSEVQVGWRYYPDTDTFAPAPVYKYYAVVDEVNVVTNTIQTLGTITESNYIEVTQEQYDILISGGKYVYYNGSFMPLEEANYRMLLALSSVN